MKLTQKKIKIKFFSRVLIFFGLFFLQVGYPQNSEQSLNFSGEICRYFYSDSLTYLEYNISISTADLEYLPEGDSFSGEFTISATLIADDSVVESKKWKIRDKIDSLSQRNNSSWLMAKNYFVTGKGEYQLTIEVENLTTKSVRSFPVNIENFESGKLAVSDIHLASSIKRTSSEGMFVKNGYLITPTPSGIFGSGLPILYLYAEIYFPAELNEVGGGQYQVSYKIENKDGIVIKQIDPQTKDKPGTSSIEINRFTAVTLLSGSYNLILEVVDLETGQIASSQRTFAVYREGDFKPKSLASESESQTELKGSAGSDSEKYDIIDENSLDQEFEYARYLASNEERNAYRNSDLTSKRQFIKEFWAKRDPSPGTPENEVKENYFENLDYANNMFRANFQEGWKTDRGRILLMYGKPDEIQRAPYGVDAREHEVWFYFSLEGGVQFIFIDKRGLGDLDLVHSTLRGEISQYEWEQYLRP